MNLLNPLTTAAFCLVASLTHAQTAAYLPGGGNSTSLDVYPVEGARNAPVMVYVHGGAWVTGDKSRAHIKDEFFIARGYIFITDNFTLVRRGTVEQQMVEVDAAIGYITDNAARFGGNSSNISLMGHTAGAHLVLMAALNPGPRAEALLARGALKAVISNDTIAFDITQIAEAAGGRLPRLYRKPFGEAPARWAALSPASYVASAQNLPRFLLNHSGQGDASARAQVVHGFAAALRRAGAEVQVFDGGRYNHMQITRAVGVEADISAALLGFLNAN